MFAAPGVRRLRDASADRCAGLERRGPGSDFRSCDVLVLASQVSFEAYEGSALREVFPAGRGPDRP